MKLIEFPSLKWFNFGNVFTGSIGTEPEKGCLNSTTFNFKVKKTDKNKLTAVCWFVLPWKASTNMVEAAIGLFNADDFGIEVAENWLIQKCFKDYQSLKSLPANNPCLSQNNPKIEFKLFP